MQIAALVTQILTLQRSYYPWIKNHLKPPVLFCTHKTAVMWNKISLVTHFMINESDGFCGMFLKEMKS